MAYMASDDGDVPVNVPRMAADLGVSEAHLGKVLQRLARWGYVASRRGPSGGYVLARGAKELTLLQIYEAVDGPLGDSRCLLGHKSCIGRSRCIVGDLVRTVNRQVRDKLANTTLGELSFGLPAGQKNNLHAGATR
jgi:Rrf2 family protein